MKYINNKTFEVYDEDEYFNVDDLIADAVSILNKKGYKTLFSCEGHDKSYQCYRYTYDISKLDEIKNDSDCTIGKIREKDFDFYVDVKISSTYIKFKGHYNFPCLPEGFSYESDLEGDDEHSGDLIEKIVHFYENGNKRNGKDIYNDIKNANDNLLSWAKKLPNLIG